jgi:hypothetical protein
MKVSTQRRCEHPWSNGSAPGKLSQRRAHPTVLAPVSQRGGGSEWRHGRCCALVIGDGGEGFLQLEGSMEG